MKRIITALISLSIILSSVGVFAEDIVSVTLNNTPIEFDVPAQIIDDRTMVPMRKIFEALGAQVDWVEEHQGIIATKGSKIIVMKIGFNSISMVDINGGTEEQLELDVPPMIVDGRTLVPVRAISESLGVKVDWIGETKTVVLSN